MINNESALDFNKTYQRQIRNQLLSDSDWTQLNDAVLTDEEKSAWATYRQDLRDLTLQAGFPFDVTYPTKP